MIADDAVEAPLVHELRQHGVFDDGDVQVADAVARLTGDRSPELVLAAAFAVRAPRLGHVCLDLERLQAVGLTTDRGTPVAVALPDPVAWRTQLTASPAVREPGEPDIVAPLVLDGDRLYLDRYWRYEQRLVARLRELLARRFDDHDPVATEEVLDRLFPAEEDVVQRRAAASALHRGLTVLTGGPGTGKTTTLVRILAALSATTPPDPPLRVALAAPTGKAAARMAAAIRSSVDSLPIPSDLRDRLQDHPARTVHRLLGYLPGAPTRFRSDASNPLPVDVLVLDEASMASLPLMAKLVTALPPDARLLLVGDRDQLASVDAGAVLSDICGPEVGHDPAEGPASDGAEAAPDGSELPDDPPIARAIIRLTRFHRFGTDSGIGAVARAIRRAGEGASAAASAEVLALLRGERTESGGPPGYDDIAWHRPSRGSAASLPPPVLDEVVTGYAAAVRSAGAGEDPARVLDALDRLRVLAVLRHGPDGVQRLDQAIAAGIGGLVPGFDPQARFPIGRPLMVTRNDHRRELYNGDVGVVVPDPNDTTRRRVAFLAADGHVRMFAPSRLPECESVFAMSIHKSQGSQFDRVVVVLPRADNPLVTRELLYTGITRAARHVTVVAEAEVLTSALGRRVQRASGLTRRLWHPGEQTGG